MPFHEINNYAELKINKKIKLMQQQSELMLCCIIKFCKCAWRKLRVLKNPKTYKSRSSYKERIVDALAIGADEGRDKLR